jgi:hypothetical protein
LKISLVAQCFNRIELRGLSRGPKSKKDSHHRAEDECDKDGIGRDFRGPCGQFRQQDSRARAEHDPYDTSKDTKVERFDEKLPEDVAAMRTDGQADAY